VFLSHVNIKDFQLVFMYVRREEIEKNVGRKRFLKKDSLSVGIPTGHPFLSIHYH